MVTIKDVAKKAGVSVATVSYCLSGKKNIKSETQTRVREAIAELNYIPNSSARNLKSSASDEIGVILPNLDDSTNSEILKGIITQADKEGYSVNIACSYNNPHVEQDIINKFISKNYTGIILMTCQSGDSSFFKNTFYKYDISNVFIMRLPPNISANFLGFDNYNTSFYLTEALLKKGYKDVVIVAGPADFFSESEFINGYVEAHDKFGIPCWKEKILNTDMSKEGAFKVAMLYMSTHLPQAIIASSQTIMDGIIEACDVYNIKPGKNVCLLTLSEERWNKSSYYPDVIHTAETAYTLGEDSFRILLEENSSDQLYDRKFKLYKDNVLDSEIDIPKPLFQPVKVNDSPRQVIKIASVKLPTIQALEAISYKFFTETGILLSFHYYSLRDLFMLINEDIASSNPMYDIYLSDVSWMRYFYHKDAFMDISSMLDEIPELNASLYPTNLNNAKCDGHLLGFPIIGGTQFLFYRKDLFSDPHLQRAYKDAHNISLRPPRTWKEFNAIAKFFTQKYNPDSPTKYGTAISQSITEDFMLELLIRLWSYDGGIYNNRNQLELNTPQNIRAFQNILETSDYTPPYLGSSETTFEQIGRGNIAMAISFTEYASAIQNALHPEFLSKIGYSMLPGKTPANVGWHLCISKSSEKAEDIKKLFKWLCQRQNSYYQTILCGQSTLRFPHAHHELLRLYPWLELTEEGLNNCRARAYPVKGKNQLVTPANFESYFRAAFQKMREGMDISEALTECQKNIERHFR